MVIDYQASAKEAFAKIDENHFGLIFVIDSDGAVCAAATDGDIRRGLLRGLCLDDPISAFANADFIWKSENAEREELLKVLDHRVKVIPLLDSAGRLVKVVTNESFPTLPEQRVYARARAPVRVSFGGGGSDVTHFFSSHLGAVLSSTISVYSHATLRVRDDQKIYINSIDLDLSFMIDSFAKLNELPEQFRLLKAIIELVNPEIGFDLYLYSEFPIKSGLGGSSAVSACVFGVFNELRRDKWDSHELAALAFQAERLVLGVNGGWQDQYAAVFGGINFIEFKTGAENVVSALRVKDSILRELESSLVLCDTGISHDSGFIHKTHRSGIEQGLNLEPLKASVELSYQMRNLLIRGQLRDFGLLLDEAWQLKKKYSSAISSETLNRVYEGAKKHGALGGKILGAGGGGFFLFYADSFEKNLLIEYLEKQELNVVPFRFESAGLQSWSVRDVEEKKRCQL